MKCAEDTKVCVMDILISNEPELPTLPVEVDEEEEVPKEGEGKEVVHEEEEKVTEQEIDKELMEEKEKAPQEEEIIVIDVESDEETKEETKEGN